MKTLIRTTYEICTLESVMDGDVEERGWIDEEGTPYTFREAFKILRGCEPSASHFHKGVWYTRHEYHQDFTTGENESRSYHLSDAPINFQRRLFNAVKSAQRSQP
jgi:hypothetical protein